MSEFAPLNKLLDHLDNQAREAKGNIAPSMYKFAQAYVLQYLQDFEGLHCAIDQQGNWHASYEPMPGVDDEEYGEDYEDPSIEEQE